MLKAIGIALACLATASDPTPAPDSSVPLNLHLICRGVGDRAVDHVGFAGIFGRHSSATALTTSSEQEQFGEQMDIEIAGNSGKARVPRRFLPPLHGGDGGWFNMKDVVIGDDTITGTVLINYANHPKMRLDRRTGSVAMDGKVGAYAGECRPYDPKEQRAF